MTKPSIPVSNAVFALAALLCTTACLPEKRVRPDVAGLSQFVRQAQSRPGAVLNSPGSLFNQAAPLRDFYTDVKARYVDDIVTIVVSETTNAVSTVDASTSNKSTASNAVTNLAGLEKVLTNIPTLATGTGSKTFQGAGSTNRTSQVTSTITARVMDAMPNGNLVIEGLREININNEYQTIVVTGIVRPEDVNSSNQVPSAKVANLQVFLQGRGQVTQSMRPGWLFRILNGILPF